jgi:hypothetical protein
MSMLIAITGKKNHGKDSVGRILASELNLRQDSFAAPIKSAAKEWFDLSEGQVNGMIAEKETIDPRWGITPRFVLQTMGTEVARSIHPDVWARALIRRHESAMAEAARKWEHGPGAYRPVGTVVTDLRFENEAHIIRSHGGIILYVTRGSISENEFSAHASETSVETIGAKADYFIRNDGTLDDLQRQVSALAYDLRTGG